MMIVTLCNTAYLRSTWKKNRQKTVLILSRVAVMVYFNAVKAFHYGAGLPLCDMRYTSYRLYALANKQAGFRLVHSMCCIVYVAVLEFH